MGLTIPTWLQKYKMYKPGSAFFHSDSSLLSLSLSAQPRSVLRPPCSAHRMRIRWAHGANLANFVLRPHPGEICPVLFQVAV
ncbi:hypothetical protein chiPu_0017224 [Chiloscyllium punctatum]|uniref:Uncharacterized protein n=1 Tax=Chiloscyllium punctatum TaxID=137246 RepID=A0A401T7U6_CHIPU|nr:hypothetical protein [Chiloscyllium punctatum]